MPLRGSPNCQHFGTYGRCWGHLLHAGVSHGLDPKVERRNLSHKVQLMTDLYRVLGVSRRATDHEIKSAYRRLARSYHPDVSSSPDANSRFVKISEAYRILSDPEKRDLYDHGIPLSTQTTYYGSRAAEVAAYQRKFDKVVDEMIAEERKETAARSQAVTLVVTLFVSAFLVTLAKPLIIEDLNLIGRVALVALSVVGLHYFIKNLRVALARYTYSVPDRLISVFNYQPVADKIVSRTAALVFLGSGYIVSLGLGYLIGRLIVGPDPAPGTFLGVFLYPPIAIFIIGSFRQIGGVLDRL
jgi:hypothetical protein